MSGTKDPAIKLFGKTIPLPSNEEVQVFHGDKGGGGGSYKKSKSEQQHVGDDQQSQSQSQDKEESIQVQVKEGSQPPYSEELTDKTFSENNDNPKTPSCEKEVGSTKASMNEEEQSEASSSQEKPTLKKPDKIIPCPRCNSMDTKFCYYNNYNVNQPRHFCKNCQRYWTAGGTMRNVPVGAGRRKNKSSVSHYRHITVSEALQTVRTEASNGIQHPAVKPNGTILTFGPDAPLCESMASVLSLAEKNMLNCSGKGIHNPEEQRVQVSCGGESGDETSNRSCVTASSSTEEGRRVGPQDPMMQTMNGFPPQMPYYAGGPWQYPWNPTQWNSGVPQPAFCPQNFPISFFPAPTYWGCPIPGTWGMPWLSQPPSTSSNGAPVSAPSSPNLGKHSREGDIIKPSIPNNKDWQKHNNNSAGCVLIPKTLRIDDPGEAAKSSIWATLGIQNEKSDSIHGGRLFKAFQSKGDEKNHMDENSKVLHANPAALSRSVNFHENS